MSDQLIISIGCEFGSGGHEIGEKLAELYHLPFYDHNLLDEIAKARDLDGNELAAFDESVRNKLLSRTVCGFNNSPSYNVAHLQFDYLKKKADAGESFIIVGRCAEHVLRSTKGLISIFVLGDREEKLARVMRIYHLPEDKAEKLMKEKDKKRKDYHNSYCDGKWGDSRNYDLSVNSSKLSIEENVRLLQEYINARRAHV